MKTKRIIAVFLTAIFVVFFAFRSKEDPQPKEAWHDPDIAVHPKYAPEDKWDEKHGYLNEEFNPSLLYILVLCCNGNAADAAPESRKRIKAVKAAILAGLLELPETRLVEASKGEKYNQLLFNFVLETLKNEDIAHDPSYASLTRQEKQRIIGLASVMEKAFREGGRPDNGSIIEWNGAATEKVLIQAIDLISALMEQGGKDALYWEWDYWLCRFAADCYISNYCSGRKRFGKTLEARLFRYMGDADIERLSHALWTISNLPKTQEKKRTEWYGDDFEEIMGKRKREGVFLEMPENRRTLPAASILELAQRWEKLLHEKKETRQ